MILKSNKPCKAVAFWIHIFHRKALQHPWVIHRYACLAYVFVVTKMVQGWRIWFANLLFKNYYSFSCILEERGVFFWSLCCSMKCLYWQMPNLWWIMLNQVSVNLPKSAVKLAITLSYNNMTRCSSEKQKMWRCVTADLGFKILYELFCVPLPGNWRCFSAYDSYGRVCTFWYAYAGVRGAYDVSPVCIFCTVVICKFCQFPALYVHKGFPIAVGSR